jgi:putative phosphoserine phosphatase/1-acylglycerol-3-phosphate O-acyltransferase
VPAALATRSWRYGVNLAMSTWGELGTALAGLNVVVTGEEHVWSHRPAVFIFNHQSAIDTLILAKILRRDFVAVAKKEVRRHPILGPAFAFAGTVFIDRYDRERAIQALAPAVEALRSGLSLVIAPEGTRSATPRLGPFKKGAFHLAMRAEVPLVPVVIRNAIDAMPKHAMVARPATVEVSVLPPVDTRSWRVTHLEEHMREVRDMFLSALD